MMPLKDTNKPALRHPDRPEPGPPVKQCNTVLSGTPSASRTSNRSSQAGGALTTRVRECAWANAILCRQGGPLHVTRRMCSVEVVPARISPTATTAPSPAASPSASPWATGLDAIDRPLGMEADGRPTLRQSLPPCSAPRRTSRTRATAWRTWSAQSRYRQGGPPPRPMPSLIPPTGWVRALPPFPPPPRYSSCTWQCESNQPLTTCDGERAAPLSPHHFRRRSRPRRRHPAGGPPRTPPDRKPARPRLRWAAWPAKIRTATMRSTSTAIRPDRRTSGPGSIFQARRLQLGVGGADEAPRGFQRILGRRSQAAPVAAKHLGHHTGQGGVRIAGLHRHRRTSSAPRWPPGRRGCPGCWPDRRCSADDPLVQEVVAVAAERDVAQEVVPQRVSTPNLSARAERRHLGDLHEPGPVSLADHAGLDQGLAQFLALHDR